MPAYPEFTLDRELRACVVTRELIQKIEQQLISAERDLIGDPALSRERKFDLSVIDAHGSEAFPSAADIRTTGFPETTETVRFTIDSQYVPADAAGEWRVFKAKLTFRAESGNRLLIRIRGPNARERALGLLDRLEQLIESQAIDSWLFQRREGILGLCGLLALFGGFFWSVVTYDHLTSPAPSVPSNDYWLWTAIIATVAAYYAIVRWLVPPCAFETSRWSKLESWRRWAKHGFATFVVFEGVLAVLWRQLIPLVAP